MSFREHEKKQLFSTSGHPQKQNSDWRKRKKLNQILQPTKE